MRFRQLGLPNAGRRDDATSPQTEDDSGDDELRKLKRCAHQDHAYELGRRGGEDGPSTTPYVAEESAGQAAEDTGDNKRG